MNLPLTKQSGFTLVELVIVLVLLGILSVVAMPKFFNAGDLQKKGFCNEVASALRYGQKLALAEGCDIRARTSVAGVDLYRREVCDSSSAFNLPVTHPGKGGNYTVAPPAGIALSNSAIIFDAMGRARDGAGATADFTITVGGDLTLNVVGETGLIRTP